MPAGVEATVRLAGAARPRAAAVAAALLVHGALVLALALQPGDPPEPDRARGMAATTAGPSVLWVRALPPAPAADLAPPVTTSPPLPSPAPSTDAAWQRAELVHAGARLELDYPDVEVPARGLQLMLDLQLDDHGQVVAVAGPDQGLRGLVRRHAEERLIGAVIAGAHDPGARRVCLRLSLDPAAARLRWRAVVAPPQLTRPCAAGLQASV